VTTAMAGLLARGSLPCTAFPVSQWHVGARLAAYSCGGSHGIGASFKAIKATPHRVPIQSPKGTIGAILPTPSARRQ